MPSNSRNEEIEKRIIRLMPRSLDLTVIFLKGHLLIEEHLTEFLQTVVRRPESLKDARFTFFQLSRFFLSMSGYRRNSNLFHFLTDANSIRNLLVHSAEVVDLEQRVDSLLRIYSGENFRHSTNVRDRTNRLKKTFAFVCGEIRGATICFQR